MPLPDFSLLPHSVRGSKKISIAAGHPQRGQDGNVRDPKGQLSVDEWFSTFSN